jgi:hypothetical protein
MIANLRGIRLASYLEHRLAQNLKYAHDYFVAGKIDAGLGQLTAFRESLSLVSRAKGSSLDDKLQTLFRRGDLDPGGCSHPAGNRHQVCRRAIGLQAAYVMNRDVWSRAGLGEFCNEVMAMR